MWNLRTKQMKIEGDKKREAKPRNRLFIRENKMRVTRGTVGGGIG